MLLRMFLSMQKRTECFLVIDEFPFLWETLPVIVSDIRDLIDEYKSQSAMKFVLSGSYVDVMKSLNDGGVKHMAGLPG